MIYFIYYLFHLEFLIYSISYLFDEYMNCLFH